MLVDLNIPILVIDSVKSVRKMIVSMLLQIGFNNIDDVEGGDAALIRIEENRYGLIISDENMEPMSGLELLQKIRSSDDPKIKRILFIMVTSDSTPENIIKAKHAGVNNYIVKPFTLETLKRKIEGIIG